MNEVAGLAKCWACHNTIPDILTHEHHRSPRAAGGGDEESNRVVICPICHTAVHQSTRQFLKGKIGATKDTLTLLVKGDTDWGVRLLELVREEAKAWQAGDKPMSQLVTLRMPRDAYGQLKSIAKLYTKQNGRPFGVGNLMRNIIMEWMNRWLRDRGEETGTVMLSDAQTEVSTPASPPTSNGGSKSTTIPRPVVARNIVEGKLQSNWSGPDGVSTAVTPRESSIKSAFYHGLEKKQ